MSAAEQLKLLHELQQIDEKIMDLNRFQEKAPEQVQTLHAKIEEQRQLITVKEGDLQKHLETRRAKERELETHEAQIAKNQTRSMSVKTNEEFHAIQRENDLQKELIEDLEDEILRLMDDIDSAELAVKKAKDRFKEVQKELLVQIEDLNRKMQLVEHRLAEQEELRGQMEPKIQPSFLNRYNKLRIITGGIAVVRVKNRTCMGCRMNVPPQVYNLVIKNEDIHTCPNCFRILYYEPEDNGATATEKTG